MIRKIEEFLRLAVPKGDTREPLVIQHAICNELADEIVRIGSGESRFPFTDVAIQILAPDEKQAAIFESAFKENDRLEGIIRQNLANEGCRLPDRLNIEITIVRDAQADWAERGFHIDCHRLGENSPAIRLTVLRGQATKTGYRFNKNVIRLGRLEELRDRKGVPQPSNDVVFLDIEDEINRSVSRRHARIEYDANSREFRLFDWVSKRGTYRERDGEFIQVKGPRGVELQSNDIICLGDARLQVEIIEPEDITETQ